MRWGGFGLGLALLMLYLAACAPVAAPTLAPRPTVATTSGPTASSTETALTPASLKVAGSTEVAGTAIPSPAAPVAATTPVPASNPGTVSNGGVAGAVEFETLPVRERVDLTFQVQEMTSNDARRWSGGKQLLANARMGALVRFILMVDKGGTYALSLYATRAPDFGQVQVKLDGKPLGEPIDLYAATVLPSGAINLGSFELGAGAHDLAFSVIGKNAASKDYKFALDSYTLIAPGSPAVQIAPPASTPSTSSSPSPTFPAAGNVPGATEFETLPIKDKTDMECEILNGAAGIQWSGGKRLACTGKQVGASVRFTLPIERTGRYLLNLYTGKAPNGAQVQITWDGQAWEAPLDFFAASLMPSGRLAVGIVDLGAGPHDLGFRVVGKNGGSAGFGIILDAMTLTSVP